MVRPPELGARAATALLLGLAAVAAAAAAWSGALTGYFCADDFGYVAFGRALSQASVADSLRWFWFELPPEVGLRYYRPLLGLSYAWSYPLCGDDPAGHRSINLALHVGCAWLVGLLGWRLSGRRGVMVAAAWLFLLSPAHPESLLWLSSRVNLLAALWIALAAWAFVAWCQGGRSWLAAVWALAVPLALASKETGVIAPPLLTAAAVCLRGGAPPGRRVVAASALTWLWLIPYFAARLYALGELGGGYLGEVEPDLLGADYWIRRLALVRLLLSPVAAADWTAAAKLGLLAAHVAMLAFALALAARRALPRSALAWLGLWLLGSFVPIYKAPFVESTLEGARLLYDPTAPVVLAVAWAAFGGAGRVRVRGALVALLIAGYPLLLTANAQPWLRAGRLAAELDRTVRGLAAAHDEAWVVELPRTIGGAYFVLGDADPIRSMLYGPEVPARVRGVRAREWPRVLAEMARRLEDGTARDWQLHRVCAAALAIEPEPVAEGLPQAIDDRIACIAARVGQLDGPRIGDVTAQMLLRFAEPAAVEIRLELRRGADVRRSAPRAVRLGAGDHTVDSPSLRLPAPDGGLRWHAFAVVQTGTGPAGAFELPLPRR